MNKLQPSNPDKAEKPTVVLPTYHTTHGDTARQLSEIIKQLPDEKKLYERGGRVHFIETNRKTGEQVLSILSPTQAKSDFEEIATLKKNVRRTVKGEFVYEQVQDVCSDSTAKGILESRVFLKNLPSINLITNSPTFVQREDGKCEAVCGYDEHTGILAKGKPVREMQLEEAVSKILDLFKDYDFQTEGDKSRAIANAITPSLRFGGILKTRPPMAIVEADKSQAGKGFFNRIVCSLYNEKASVIAQRKGGVGSLDESFDSALVTGNPFVSLDNLRGRVDSPLIEAFMTEDSHLARVPYAGSVYIDPHDFTIFATSNNLDMTTDLANRASIVRIKKKPMGYQFSQFAEGNILAHLKANQTSYQSALFAIAKEYCEKGKPQTNEERHDFRDWAKPLDWIVQNIFGCAPLMDGHNEAKQCATTPQFQWLREATLAVEQFGFLGEPLPTGDMAEILSDSGIELPASDGCPYDELEESGKKQVCSQLGRKLSGIFRQAGSGDTIEFGGYIIERKTRKEKFESGKSADINVYIFTRQAA